MIAELTFQREKLGDVWDELLPLLQEHWKEIAHYKDIPLDPDKAVYDRMEWSGAVRLFTLRDAGELTGYAVFFIVHHPHYKTSKQAQQDVIYIAPKARGGTGSKFIADCDDELRKEGVQIVSHHVKAAHNFGPALERLGYELMDLIFTKRLD